MRCSQAQPYAARESYGGYGREQYGGYGRETQQPYAARAQGYSAGPGTADPYEEDGEDLSAASSDEWLSESAGDFSGRAARCCCALCVYL